MGEESDNAMKARAVVVVLSISFVAARS